MAADSSGFYYVGYDAGILRGSHGDFIPFAIGTSWQQPAGMAFDAATGRLYVVTKDTNIRYIDTSTGVVALYATGLGSAWSLAIDPVTGQMYSTSYNVGIMKVSSSGKLTLFAGWYGNYVLANVAGLAVDSSSNVYASDLNSRSVFKYSPGGTLLNTLTAYGSTAFNENWGLAVDASSNLYVADSIDGFGGGTTSRNAIYVFSSSGAPLRSYSVTGGSIRSIALSSDGSSIFACNCFGGCSGQNGFFVQIFLNATS